MKADYADLINTIKSTPHASDDFIPKSQEIYNFIALFYRNNL